MMLPDAEIVQGELVPYDEPAPLTLFGTSDPRVALERMADVATVLVDVIKSRKLFVRIGDGEHITAEGWTTLGGMLGIVPVVVWTRPNETGDGYLARVEACTLDGRVVGAAESECSRAERRWKTAEPFAIRSMAQTRAIGRALRAPLGQIVVLAGYEPAGAEEIPAEPAPPPAAEADGTIPAGALPTVEQRRELVELLDELEDRDPGTDWRAKARELAGVSYEMLTEGVAAMLLRKLRAELEREGSLAG
jgi:hypothetical protein